MKQTKIVVLILAITALLSGCGNTATSKEYIDLSRLVSSEITANSKTADIITYFQDENGYIVPVMTTIPWTEGIAKAVIRKMMNTSELQRELVIMGLESLIPPETAINGMDISNGLAKIDFNTAELTFKSARAEQNFVDGVVLALTSFPTVETVQFMFNGHVIESLPNGTKVNTPLSATDINPASSTKNGESTLVFYHQSSNTNYEYFVPVTVYLENSNAFTALNYLIENEGNNLKTGIPTGTRLIEIEEIGDTLCVFLNDEFNSLKECSVAEETAAIKSIALTLAGFHSDKRLKLYAGKHEYVPYDSVSVETVANVS